MSRSRHQGVRPCAVSSRAMPIASWRSRLLAIACLVVLTIAAHGRAIGSGYCWDDALTVLGNEHVRNLDVVGTLGGGLWSGAGVQVPYWRPVALLSLAAQFAITQEPWFLHLGNLVVHVAVVLLVFGVSLRGTRSVAAAFSGAALFALHPVTVEVASGIANRGDALATAFALLAILAHAGGLSAGRMVGTAAAVFAACASKETGVAAVPALMAWDLFFRAEGDARALARMLRGRLGIAWASASSAAVAYLVLRRAAVGPFSPAPDFLRNPISAAPWATQKILALAASGQAGRLLVWPHRLSVDYSFHALPTNALEAAPLAVTGAGIAALLLVVTVRTARRHPSVAFGTVLAALGWLPASNLIVPIEVMFAERFLYLPAAGACVAISGVVAGFLARETGSKVLRTTAAAAGAAVLVALGVRTASRTMDWADQRSLVVAATIATPTNARVQLAWAQLLADENRWPEAELAYARATSIWPEFAAAWTERSEALRVIGRRDEAIAAASRALQLDPDDPICWYNHAVALAVAGRLEAALAQAREGVTRHPAYAPLRGLAVDLERRLGTSAR